MKYALTALASFTLGALCLWLWTGHSEADLRQRANEYLARVSELEGSLEDLGGQLSRERLEAGGIRASLERATVENRRLVGEVAELGKQLGVIRRSFSNVAGSIGSIEKIIREVQKRSGI